MNILMIHRINQIMQELSVCFDISQSKHCYSARVVTMCREKINSFPYDHIDI